MQETNEVSHAEKVILHSNICKCDEREQKVREVIEEMLRPVCGEISAKDQEKMWRYYGWCMENKLKTCADRLQKIFS